MWRILWDLKSLSFFSFLLNKIIIFLSLLLTEEKSERKGRKKKHSLRVTTVRSEDMKEKHNEIAKSEYQRLKDFGLDFFSLLLAIIVLLRGALNWRSLPTPWNITEEHFAFFQLFQTVMWTFPMEKLQNRRNVEISRNFVNKNLRKNTRKISPKTKSDFDFAANFHSSQARLRRQREVLDEVCRFNLMWQC